MTAHPTDPFLSIAEAAASVVAILGDNPIIEVDDHEQDVDSDSRWATMKLSELSDSDPEWHAEALAGLREFGFFMLTSFSHPTLFARLPAPAEGAHALLVDYLDGEERVATDATTVAEFLGVNEMEADGYSVPEILASLRRGEVFRGGGGAAPAFALRWPSTPRDEAWPCARS